MLPLEKPRYCEGDTLPMKRGCSRVAATLRKRPPKRGSKLTGLSKIIHTSDPGSCVAGDRSVTADSDVTTKQDHSTCGEIEMKRKVGYIR